MKRLAIALCFILAACQTTSESAGVMRDQVGNVYPAQCRGDLSNVYVILYFVDRATIRKKSDGRATIGVALGQVVYVADDLKPDIRDDVVRHEKCHVIAGNWHPEGSNKGEDL